MAKRLFAILGVLFLVAAGAAAQGTTSRLVGTVTDATGGVLPGVTVTLTNEATGVTYTTVTSDVGNYVFDALVSGIYTVKAELAGFKTVTATKNPVEIGQPTTVNIKLEPGDIAETVQVVAQSEVVQVSTSGNLGTVVDEKVMEALPIVGSRGRNPLELVTALPGVVSGANTGGGVHVYGARDRSWNYTLDGIDINETSAGGSNFAPLRANPDSLAEFKVLTGNQTAEYGRNSGGQVAMVTRTGTNQFKGTVFYMMRDPKLNANEWETNAVSITKEAADRSKTQFFQDIGGFSLGGPILRNKTFFFGNLQILRAKRSPEITRTVYTDLARQGIWRYVIGGRNQPAGTANASVDANGNVLPGVNIGTYNIVANDPQRIGLDRTIQGYLANMPSPNYFGVGDGLNTAGFRFSPIESEEQYDFVLRVDQVLSQKHYLFARLAKGEQNTLCDIGNSGQPPYPGMECVVNTFRSPENYMGNWRWNPRGNMVNELAVGWNEFFFDFQTPTSDASIPWLSVSDVLMSQDNTTWGNKRTLRTFQIVNNLSWIKGAHNLKFGTNMRFQRHTDTRGSVSGGSNVTPVVNFSTAVNTVDIATFGIPSNIQQANDLPLLQRQINVLLGRVGAVSQGFVSQGDVYAPGGTLFDVTANYPEVDFFGQDTWQFRPNITVDLGLRWEWKLSPNNPDDLLARPNQRVAVGETPTNALAWVTEPLYDSDYNNVAPSLGVAWDPGNDGRSVIRGNYRMAFDRINTFAISSAVLQSIPGITTGVTNQSYGQAGGRLSGLPGLFPSVTPTQALAPPAVSNNTMTVMDSEFQTPITHAWAFSYQRELWSRTLIELAYIGRKADNLFGAYDANQAEIFQNGFVDAFKVVKGGGESALVNQLMAPDTRRGTNETGSQLMRRLFPTELANNSVAIVARDIGRRVQSGLTLSELSGLGPYFFFAYPQYLNGINVIDSNDWSRYHAFQAKLEKRFAQGYSYLLAYTLARSKDTRSFDPAFTVVSGANNQSASSTPFDIGDRSLNYARSDFDRLHSFTGTFVLELPFGRDKWLWSKANAVVNQIIGGWQVASQFYWQSGRPFTVYSGWYTLSSIVQTPGNCNDCGGDEGAVYQDPSLSPGTNTWYFSPEERAKFSQPGAGEFSNVGRNAFTGPAAFNMNLSVTKRFFMPFGHQLEFRMDATNVTNTPTFGFPTATMTSSLFGRIGTGVISGSRKIQLGLKYYF